MKNELPEGFTVRVPTPDDAQTVTNLICQCDTADYGEPDYSLEDVRADWRRSGFELQRDAWLIFAREGALAAYGNAWDTGAHVRTEQTCVHPNYRGRGLEEFLIERVEAYTREIAESKTIQWIMSMDHVATIERFVQRGYQPTRHDYVMEIVMSEAPPAPTLAESFVMRAFERGRDERAVWACTQEAFRDHRGHSDLAFEEWAKGFFEHADWSSELSTVVMQGDEVVAATMAFHFFNGGWILQLGVRRAWRKHGLGLAMLYRVFGECFTRGISRVGLGVDAYSLTGATRLYEHAGMKIKNHYVRYEKEIT